MNWTFNGNFHRNLIFCNISLTGKYRYKDVFQILTNEVNLPTYNSGFQVLDPIIFEYNSAIYTNYNRLNGEEVEVVESFRHLDFSRELRAHMSLISNANFFVEKSYKITMDNLGKEYSVGKFTKGQNLNRIKYNDEYILNDNNHLYDEVMVPTFTEKYFDNYFALDEVAMNRYKMSLMLYFNSIEIRAISPSMSYLSLISSIENLFEFEGERSSLEVKRCEKCGSLLYKSTRKFKDFMMKYYPVNSPKYNKYLNDIYSRRSKITHAGYLHYNDYADTELDINGSMEVSRLKTMVRVALFNWILSQNGSDGDGP